MQHSSPHGHSAAKLYHKIGLESAVMSASPHQLMMLLLEGAKEAVRMARLHMANNAIAAKGMAISKAINIIESGLKASLDNSANDEGGKLANNLIGLYSYISNRLLYANLYNDPEKLNEAEQLLENIRAAWQAFGEQLTLTTKT